MREFTLVEMLLKNQLKDLVLSYKPSVFESFGESGQKGLKSVLNHVFCASTLKGFRNKCPFLSFFDHVVNQN